jgi:hypothetical protein
MRGVISRVAMVITEGLRALREAQGARKFGERDRSPHVAPCRAQGQTCT